MTTNAKRSPKSETTRTPYLGVRQDGEPPERELRSNSSWGPAIAEMKEEPGVWFTFHDVPQGRATYLRTTHQLEVEAHEPSKTVDGKKFVTLWVRWPADDDYGEDSYDDDGSIHEPEALPA